MCGQSCRSFAPVCGRKPDKRDSWNCCVMTSGVGLVAPLQAMRASLAALRWVVPQVFVLTSTGSLAEACPAAFLKVRDAISTPKDAAGCMDTRTPGHRSLSEPFRALRGVKQDHPQTSRPRSRSPRAAESKAGKGFSLLGGSWEVVSRITTGITMDIT